VLSKIAADVVLGFEVQLNSAGSTYAPRGSGRSAAGLVGADLDFPLSARGCLGFHNADRQVSNTQLPGTFRIFANTLPICYDFLYC
jgi:hypothetical protein